MKAELDSWVILLGAPALLLAWVYHGKASPGRECDAVLVEFGSFFVLGFLVPFLYARLLSRRPLAEIGLGLGEARRGLVLVAVLLPLVVVPVAYFGAMRPDIRAAYPLCRALLDSRDGLFAYQAASVLLYYAGWEFFFRGFLLFGLKDAVGAGRAICIQTALCALVHIGKPEVEALGTIVSGTLFGVLALQTRSIWYGWILHAALGVLTDLFVIGGPR